MGKRIVENKYFFVDEAGNPSIFDKKGKIIVGTPGCSRYFIIGFLDIDDPVALRSDLENLRKSLLQDPYFHNVPSMQLRARKTALAFHAKDDVPEVRREVYRYIHANNNLKFNAVVKDKLNVVHYAIDRRKANPIYRYNPNELYDFLTRRLFKSNLHLAPKYEVCYAIRGNKPRTEAFGESLLVSQTRFLAEKELQNKSEISITPTYSKNEPCLQATDYFLWALQRIYEMREDRYFSYLRDQFKLIIDIDDTRHKKYGEYYDGKNLLQLDKLPPI